MWQGKVMGFREMLWSITGTAHYTVRTFAKLINLSTLMFSVIFLSIAVTIKGGGADMPLFENIKTNAGTQPKNELA